MSLPAVVIGAFGMLEVLEFTVLVLALAWDTGAFARRKEEQRPAGQAPPSPGRILAIAMMPLILGIFFATGCILAAPTPKVPDKPYPADKALDTCRVPYRAS